MPSKPKPATHGGRRKGAGRPRGPGRALLWAQVTPQEKDRLQAHCERVGVTSSELIRQRLADVLSGVRVIASDQTTSEVSYAKVSAR